MDFFSNFLQQKVPKSGKELPVYYRKALCVSEILLIAYFFVCFFFYPLFLDVWIWFPLGFAVVTGAALLAIVSLTARGARGSVVK